MAKLFIHEEKYRGQKLLDKIACQHLTFCGCGAVGSNLAENMIRQGFQKVKVIDFDRVEEHNRHTQIWGRRHAGMLKATAMNNIMFDEMKMPIEAVTTKLESSNIKKLIEKSTLVIDGFDNVASRKLVTDYCRDNKINCLHVGLYKDCADVTWNETYRVPGEVTGMDVCEYALARNTVLLAITVATDVIIRWLDTGVKESYFITLKDFKIIKS